MYFKSAYKYNCGLPPYGSGVKNPPAMQETQKWVLSLGWEDPLEEGMATHCSILAWESPWPRKALVGYSP